MARHSILDKHFSMVVVAFLLAITTAGMHASPVTVTSSVVPEGINFLYDFGITNNSSTDPFGQLISVDFNLPAGSVIGNATAPVGNGATTDPSGDFVEFTSDNISGFVQGMTVDGFQFVSPLDLTSLPFTANYLDQAETTLTTFNGNTNAVPEPGAF
ncbi:MAG: hypothetical protein JOZ32_16155, partial [Bryobacterales bacterium]|nr:hypothetical protein [Bryobacterales bacterium]